MSALALVAKHPEDVRKLVAHVPPLTSVVPDAENAKAAVRAISDSYQRGGFGAGMAHFMAITSHRGPFPDDIAHFREWLPRRTLAPFVSCVWVQRVAVGSESYLHRTAPDGSVELVCEAREPLKVAGSQRGPREELLPAGATVIGLRLRPGATRPRRRRTAQRVRASVQRMLDALTSAPAFVVNGRSDILAANALAHALYSEAFPRSPPPGESGPLHVPRPARATFFPDWDRVAAEVATALRSEAGRDPYDRALSDLVGELSTRSDTFRTLWAAHNVRVHDTGVKRIHHPLVGDLELTYETMALTANPGLTIAVFTAEPGSKSEQALNLLASWTATHEQPESAFTRPHG